MAKVGKNGFSIAIFFIFTSLILCLPAQVAGTGTKVGGHYLHTGSVVVKVDVCRVIPPHGKQCVESELGLVDSGNLQPAAIHPILCKQLGLPWDFHAEEFTFYMTLPGESSQPAAARTDAIKGRCNKRLVEMFWWPYLASSSNAASSTFDSNLHSEDSPNNNNPQKRVPQPKYVSVDSEGEEWLRIWRTIFMLGVDGYNELLLVSEPEKPLAFRSEKLPGLHIHAGTFFLGQQNTPKPGPLIRLRQPAGLEVLWKETEAEKNYSLTTATQLMTIATEARSTPVACSGPVENWREILERDHRVGRELKEYASHLEKILPPKEERKKNLTVGNIFGEVLRARVCNAKANKCVDDVHFLLDTGAIDVMTVRLAEQLGVDWQALTPQPTPTDRGATKNRPPQRVIINYRWPAVVTINGFETHMRLTDEKFLMGEPDPTPALLGPLAGSDNVDNFYRELAANRLSKEELAPHLEYTYVELSGIIGLDTLPQLRKTIYPVEQLSGKLHLTHYEGAKGGTLGWVFGGNGEVPLQSTESLRKWAHIVIDDV